jgi:hypothetical protein
MVAMNCAVCCVLCALPAVEDLMQLVQACRDQPEMEMRLRETLNMARDVEKWRNLIRMLSEKVRKLLLPPGCLSLASLNYYGALLCRRALAGISVDLHRHVFGF